MPDDRQSLDTKIVMVCGFELDITEQERDKLLADPEAMAVLVNLSTLGAAVVELDDSPHEGIRLLASIGGDYWEMYTNTERTKVFVAHNRFNVRLT